MSDSDQADQITLEEMFVDTMEDLRRRSALTASRYEMVQTAGLVRRLIIDSPSIVVQVNREARMKLTFPVSGHMIMMGRSTSAPDGIWCHGPWLDPDLAKVSRVWTGSDQEPPPGTATTATRKLDDFLKHSVALGGVPGGPSLRATVLDVVKLYAHNLGGVHWEPVTATDSLLADILQIDERFLRQSMAAIARCTYRGLEPLLIWAILIHRPHPFGLGRFAGWLRSEEAESQ